jgi:hypothetical protein
MEIPLQARNVPGRYYYFIWKVEQIEVGNVFAALFRDPNSPDVILGHRFRLYRDDKIDPDSEDDRLWFERRFRDAREAEVFMDGVLSDLVALGFGTELEGAKLHKLSIHSADPAIFGQIIMKIPGMNAVPLNDPRLN